MIKVAGTLNGVRAIVLVLEPENMARLLSGEECILLDLQPLADDLILEPIHLIIEVPPDFDARAKALIGNAEKNGATIHTVPRESERLH